MSAVCGPYLRERSWRIQHDRISVSRRPRRGRCLRLCRRAPPGVPRPADRLPAPAQHQRARAGHRRGGRAHRRRDEPAGPGGARGADRRLADGAGRVGRGTRQADRPPLRPLRRAAARPARRVGLPALRADDPRRARLRPRRGRQQGAALRPAAGARVDPGLPGRTALQRQGAARRGGGDRQSADARLRARAPRRASRRPRHHERWPGRRERPPAPPLRRARRAQLRTARGAPTGTSTRATGAGSCRTRSGPWSISSGR